MLCTKYVPLSIMLLYFLHTICLLVMVSCAFAGNFVSDFDILWGGNHTKFLNAGSMLALSLDKTGGSGVRSKGAYIFGEFTMQLKLIPGNCVGTIATFYITSLGATHDEIDLEFLGNLRGDQYILSTNVFTQGKGNREQQFHLWFDPTLDFHTYTILWNPANIILYVDGTPIRVFKNYMSNNVPFPTNQYMKIYSTLWFADWAAGRFKIDWTRAPFTITYRNFNVVNSPQGPWKTKELDNAGKLQLQRVQKNYMTYNYCFDVHRFPQGFPPECKLPVA